ncbi:MAG TPA: DUF5996 family protein [Pseudolabrys sp.]|nr:DUF5996 family protein [Pseudolabrys sp.]
MASHQQRWPELPLSAWKGTRDTLHLWTQIVGKIRLALTPWLNHSWHVALYVTSRGLTTSPMPWKDASLEIEFDFIEHAVWLRLSNSKVRKVLMRPVPVAAFYADIGTAVSELGLSLMINPMPCEIPDAIPFDEDDVHRSYDPDYAYRFFRVLSSAHEVMSRFRTGFIGKASPVHFFWGSFDLAVTRFSGRTAPRHPGGVPHLPDAVAQEAYSHEVSSAGFWPGGGGGPINDAAFYSYAYPAPEGFAAAKVMPSDAFWSKELGEFVLPYAAMRTAADPDAVLMEFLQSTYAAAADLGHWDRAALDCSLGEEGKVRRI